MNSGLKIGGSRQIFRIGFGCAICLFLIFALCIQAQERTKRDVIATKPNLGDESLKDIAEIEQETMAEKRNTIENKKAVSQRARLRTRRSGGGVDYGKHAAFYQVIIDNNLFRPLGWVPRKVEPEYSLIGTVIDESNAIAQAIILEKRSNRYSVLSVGESLGDVTVKDIQSKTVILDKAGKQMRLSGGGLQFLSASRYSSSRRDTRSEKVGENRGDEKGDIRMSSGNQGESMEKMRKELAAKFKNASQEERKRMMMEFKEKQSKRRERVEIRRTEARRRRGDRGRGR